MTATISEARAAEIRERYAQAGVPVPKDLEAGAIATGDMLLGAARHLRAPRPAADEPSNIFSLVGRIVE